MIGMVETKKILVLDEEAYTIFNDFGILLNDMIANGTDNSIAISLLLEAYEHYKMEFEAIKMKERN